MRKTKINFNSLQLGILYHYNGEVKYKGFFNNGKYENKGNIY